MDDINLLYEISYKEKIRLINEGKGLDIFIKDPDSDVRISIAKMGYGLDILMNDSEKKVKDAVADFYEKQIYYKARSLGNTLILALGHKEALKKINELSQDAYKYFDDDNEE